MKKDLRLGVNIDHVATLREARGTCYPEVLEAAKICENCGVYCITVHLREDRRHIQDNDIYELKKNLKTRMNMEMANSPEIVDIAIKVCPDEVCLVPEKREELTTEGGLDVASQISGLSDTVKALKDAGIFVSLFIDPDERQIDATAESGAPCIELHTGTYCEAYGSDAYIDELERLLKGAIYAHKLGLRVNAGHGLNLDNIEEIWKIPYLDTLNIGHSIIAHSVFTGLENAVKEIMIKMRNYSGGRGE